MAAIRCQVILNPDAESRHQWTNTWWIVPFLTTAPDVAAGAFKVDLDAFYQTLDTNMSTLLSGKVPRFRAWDMSDPKPRQPIVEQNLTALVTSGTNVAPREVALVLSFRSGYVSGQNPQRRRGRIYFGPLRADSLNTSTGLVESSHVTALKNAGAALLAASVASTDYTWCTYSRVDDVNEDGSAGAHPVIAGWVDNDPDIQRRRGINSGAKTTF